MRVCFDFSALRRTRWYEYAARFLFGGAVTVGAGLVTKYFGPGLGGLFLAFPAIFPATATLVEKHEREKKEQAGIHKTVRGRQARWTRCLWSGDGQPGTFKFRRAGLEVASCVERSDCAVRGDGGLVVAISKWRLRKSRLVHG
jgi:hypothetical protein